MFILVLIKLQIRNSLFQNRYKISSIWQQKMHNLFFFNLLGFTGKTWGDCNQVSKISQFSSIVYRSDASLPGENIKISRLYPVLFNTEAAAIRKNSLVQQHLTRCCT